MQLAERSQPFESWVWGQNVKGALKSLHRKEVDGSPPKMVIGPNVEIRAFYVLLLLVS